MKSGDIGFRRLLLKRGEGRRVERGHLWVFANEVERLEDGEGDEAAVIAADGRFLGSAILSPSALIRARLYSRRPERLDAALIHARLQAALDFRRRFDLIGPAWRLCFSDSDGLPGLIVDLYSSHAVVQLTTAAMDARRQAVVEALKNIIQPASIYERSDVPARRLEGLDDRTGLIFGSTPAVVEITGEEYYLLDVVGGQKTGHYLDMRFNRLYLAALAAGRRVLELCCYTGAFSIGAARRGAACVAAVDSSASALALAREGARRAGVADLCEFEQGDASETAIRWQREKRRFDLILVDPPPFARSKKDAGAALRAYRDLNLRAMRLLAPGGILATASCSHHVSPEDFLHALRMAARDARADLRLLHAAGQAPDHPVHLATPETAYLKFFVFEKM
ncbi:MAG: class I SAM-dependent rRNA methyltransferase [Candidatus Sumerlaeia bacterium]